MKGENIGFVAEIFEEDQEFTLIPLAKQNVKLFCKLKIVNSQVVVKIDAVESNLAKNNAIKRVGIVLEFIQAILYIGLFLYVFSFFSRVLVIRTLCIILGVIVIAYLISAKGRKKKINKRKVDVKYVLEQLSVLINGEIIEG
ncbi:MAG: hypothetical protein GY810_01715 [Aureispira sp.]|nr:hypothetical protein [Aureispira sp.]